MFLPPIAIAIASYNIIIDHMHAGQLYSSSPCNCFLHNQTENYMHDISTYSYT